MAFEDDPNMVEYARNRAAGGPRRLGVFGGQATAGRLGVASGPTPAQNVGGGYGHLAPWAQDQVRGAGANPADFAMAGNQLISSHPYSPDRPPPPVRPAEPPPAPPPTPTASGPVPGMIPDPRTAPSIGVPKSPLGDLNYQLEVAHRRGDYDTIGQLTGQINALKSGGPDGLAAYQRNTAREWEDRRRHTAATKARLGMGPDGQVRPEEDPLGLYRYGPRSASPGYGRPRGDFGSVGGMRRSILADIAGKMAEAHGKGDMDAFAEYAARRSALDTGGFQGLANYMHQSAMNRAQRDQIGAKTDALQAQANPNDMFSDPDKMYLYTLMKTQNPELAEIAARRAEVSRWNKIGVQGGTPRALDANTAQSLIDAKYPAVSRLVGANASGQPNFTLPQIFENLQATRPEGWDDPNSELSQALAAQIKGLYGTGLDEQLRVPVNPDTLATFGPQSPLGWVPGASLVRSVVGDRPVPLLNRMMISASQGQPFENGGDIYHRRASAANWWAIINGQQPTND